MTAIKSSSLKYLKDLAKNNNREWFNDHKDKYTAMHENMIAFAEAVMMEMNKHDQLIPMTGKKSLFRIYRDVRFSKDKSPYKEYMAGRMKRDTLYLRGGYYYGIHPGNCMQACGFWNPDKEDLLRIRQQISADPKRLKSVINRKKLKETWGQLEGDTLVKCPKGFDSEDPAIDFLRHKQFLFYKKYSDKEVLEPSFYKTVSNNFKAIRPFFDYMSEILTHDLNGVSLIK